MSSARPIPLLGDVSLEFIQRIEHSLDGGFESTRIAGLPGELQQRPARGSHRIRIVGFLFGDTARDDLAKLQSTACDGEELTFASDISTALELQRVVIDGIHVAEDSGEPGRYAYELRLTENPPLPPPAELSGFGGLDDFGLGNLGFDTDILGDLQDIAGDIAGAVNDAMDVIDQLSALANMPNLGGLEGLLEPLSKPVSAVENIASGFVDAAKSLSEAFKS